MSTPTRKIKTIEAAADTLDLGYLPSIFSNLVRFNPKTNSYTSLEVNRAVLVSSSLRNAVFGIPSEHHTIVVGSRPFNGDSAKVADKFYELAKKEYSNARPMREIGDRYYFRLQDDTIIQLCVQPDTPHTGVLARQAPNGLSQIVMDLATRETYATTAFRMDADESTITQYRSDALQGMGCRDIDNKIALRLQEKYFPDFTVIDGYCHEEEKGIVTPRIIRGPLTSAPAAA